MQAALWEVHTGYSSCSKPLTVSYYKHFEDLSTVFHGKNDAGEYHRNAFVQRRDTEGGGPYVPHPLFASQMPPSPRGRLYRAATRGRPYVIARQSADCRGNPFSFAPSSGLFEATFPPRGRFKKAPSEREALGGRQKKQQPADLRRLLKSVEVPAAKGRTASTTV